MWSRADILGLFSLNVVSFSRNVVLSDPLFSLNSVSKPRMLSVRADYVLSSLQVTILIEERPDGVHISYDRMASYLAPYGNSDALKMARDLDAKIEAILTAAAK